MVKGRSGDRSAIDPAYYTAAWPWGDARTAHARLTCGSPTNDLPRTGGHPFYQRLNQVLDTHGFDAFVEAQCAPFYARDDGPAESGAGDVLPAAADRLLRGDRFRARDRLADAPTRWRCAASWAWGWTRRAPDHSTISRTRRLIDVETHRAVFTWVLQVAGDGGPGQGQDDRDRCHDAGGQRGHAEHRAARHGRDLPGVPDAAGAGVGDRDADARRPGAAGSEARRRRARNTTGSTRTIRTRRSRR